MAETFHVVSITDKNLFEAKRNEDVVKFLDLKTVYNTLHTVEQNANRNMRVIKRDVVQLGATINSMSDDTNKGFKTVSKRIDDIEAEHDLIKTDITSLEGRIIEIEKTLKDFEVDDGNSSSGRIMTLTSDPIMAQVGTYSALSTMTFDQWMRRFQDYLEAAGAKWSEAEKLGRLKLMLDGSPRQMLDDLQDDEKDTVENALKNLKKLIDSPQRRELSKQTLATCRQKPGETIQAFTERFVPLVQAAIEDPNIRKERLVELFLEKIDENISFLLKLTGAHQSFEAARAKALELENILQNKKQQIDIAGSSSNHHVYAVDQIPSEKAQTNDFPAGKFQSWGPIKERSNENRNFNNFNNNRNQNYGRFDRNRGRGRGQSSANRYANSNCYNCGRRGHIARECRDRPRNRDWNGQRGYQAQQSRFPPYRQQNVRAIQEQQPEQPVQGKSANAVNELVTMLKTKMNVEGNSGQINILSTVEPEREESKDISDVKSEEKEPAAAVKIAEWEVDDHSKNRSVKTLNSLLSKGILLFSLIILHACSSLAVDVGPMICQIQKTPTLWRMPKFECGMHMVSHEKVPIPTKIDLFSQNLVEYKTEAYVCRKVKKRAMVYTTFTGFPLPKAHDPENLPLSMEECLLMIKQNTCSFGSLINKSGLLQTDNEMNIEKGWPIIDAFRPKELVTENCFLFNTTVFTSFDSPEMQSAFSHITHCRYRDGNCTLKDHTILIWTPISEQRCRFVKTKTLEGSMMGKIWISESPDFLGFSLTFENSSTISECGHDLIVADQGYAVVVRGIVGRHRRHLEERVLSSRLSARLTFLDYDIAHTTATTLNHVINQYCLKMRQMNDVAQISLMNEPIRAVRLFFKNELLFAKQATNSIVKIWPCIELKAGEFFFKATGNDEECFELLPIGFKSGSEEMLAFLDPKTMIVVPESRKAPCNQYRKAIVELKGQAIEVDQVTGKTKNVKVGVILSFQNSDVIIPEIVWHSFHQLSMMNKTTVVDHAFVLNLVRTSEITYRIHSEGTKFYKTTSKSWQEIRNEALESVFGDLTELWRTCITIVCCIYTLDVVLQIVGLLAERYLGDGLTGRILRIRNPRRQVWKAEPQNEEIIRVIPGNPHQWPPSVSSLCLQNALPMLKMEEVESRINMLSTQKKFASIINAELNCWPLRCLVDTGATLSVIPSSSAAKLSREIIAVNRNAISASGHTIPIIGEFQSKIQVLKWFTTITLNVISDENFESKNYDVILGQDSLERFPPVTFDYQLGRVYIGFERVPSTPMFCELAVRAISNITIPAESQVIVPAKIQGAEKGACFLIENVDGRLKKAQVGSSPTVVELNERGLVPVLLTNPTRASVPVFGGTKIAGAWKIAEKGVNNADAILSIENWSKENQINSIEVDPDFVVNFESAEVKGKELEALKSLCQEFSDVFSKSKYDLGSCTVGEHEIITTTDVPVAAKPRRTPFKTREFLQQHIKVIVESDTPWVSNFVLVQKKDGSLRPCIDFRKLNDVTVPDRYPLPRLDTIMEKIGNCAFYSSLDLSSGYHQIKLTENAAKKCGVVTEEGVFEMTHLPFGLKNATSAFARTMAHVLSGLENVIAYVDDVLVFTKSDNFEEHLSSLRKVFERFRHYNLKLSPKKCIFARKSMTYLGFVVDLNGYKPSLSKIEIIKEIPEPKDVKQVKRFIGMASFFRRHIQNFATIVEPLTKLTRDKVEFVWGKEQNEAFNKIKELLGREPSLRFPDYEKPFHIFTDASLCGQGAALMQYDEESKTYHAICYCSRTLSSSERKWPAVQVELSAIIYALRMFRPYIFGAEVELHTDHKPLAYLLSKSDSHPNLARWLIELQNYNIKIVHISGKQNTLADALSRLSEGNGEIPHGENSEELQDIAEYPVCFAIESRSRMLIDPILDELLIRNEDGETVRMDIAEEQMKDPEAKILIEFLLSGNAPEEFSEKEFENLCALSRNLVVIGGILYHKQENSRARVYIPISLRNIVFDAFHNSKIGGGHMSIRKTLHKCAKYYWPKMYRDIVIKTRTCLTCQLRNSPSPSYKAEMLSVPNNTVFARVGLDLTGPFPMTEKGNKYVLNIICWFSKYIISVPVPDTKAMTIARALLERCFLVFGGCTELISDNASSFNSEFFRSFCSLISVSKVNSIPYWSQGNGVTERSFRTFHNIIAKHMKEEGKDFDDFVQCACFAYNTSVHETTRESPFFLLFGRDPIFNIDQVIDRRVHEPILFTEESDFKHKLISSLQSAWESAAKNTEIQQKKMKERYDLKVKEPVLEVGDKVMLKNYISQKDLARKHQMNWRGIFRVIKIEGIYVTITSLNSPQLHPMKVHINQLKRVFEAKGPAVTSVRRSKEEEEALKEAEAVEVSDMTGYRHEDRMEKGASECVEARKGNEVHPYNLRDRKLLKHAFIMTLVTIVEAAEAAPLGETVVEIESWIPISLLVLLLLVIACNFFINRRRKESDEDEETEMDAALQRARFEELAAIDRELERHEQEAAITSLLNEVRYRFDPRSPLERHRENLRERIVEPRECSSEDLITEMWEFPYRIRSRSQPNAKNRFI